MITNIGASRAQIRKRKSKRIRVVLLLFPLIILIVLHSTIAGNGYEKTDLNNTGSSTKNTSAEGKNERNSNLEEQWSFVPDVHDVSLRNEFTDRCVTITSPKEGQHTCNVNMCKEMPPPSSVKEEELQSYIQNRGFAIRATEELQNMKEPMQVNGKAKAGSGCAISHKYKFFFIHNLKVGGMTTKSFLKRALCPGGDPHNHIFKCSSGDDVLKVVDCKSGLRVASKQSYFIFSFVRNPYSRLFSGFAMAEGMANQRNEKKKIEADNLKNSTFLDEATRRKNYSVNSTRHVAGSDAISKQRKRMANRKSKYYPPFSFRDFVMASQQQRSRLSPTSKSHYLPQAMFLTDRSGCPVFDYIGKLEFYEDELRRIIYEIDRRYRASHDVNEYDSTSSNPLMVEYEKSVKVSSGRIAAFHGTSFGAKKKKRGNGNMESVYSEVAVAEKVCNEFKVDFDLFGYSDDVTIL
ncbi:hypothetical protein CTEN210_12172 [Chaetoceros tenuissimus]|uniref:Sulfotransferase n=1 Tax=Chaetoceros tenuissimus TaxID=426638 RepID=A0AAD3HA02_9STRA|nr:hypothetical protein CTEN210_12172 [Chaetoceros tenuissimus]